MSYEPYNPEVNFYPVNEPVKTGEGTPESPSPNSPSVAPAESNIVPTGGGTIMNGGEFRSPNYVKGIAGWRIGADGMAEFDDLDVRDNAYIGDRNGTYIHLDGTNTRIRSSNYVQGVSGFTIEPTLIEAENLVARGTMRGATFKYDVVSSVGGQLMVANSDALASDMTALDASTMTTRGDTTFAVDDILVMRGVTASGIQEEWFRVTNIASAPTYTVTRDLAAAFGANSNPVWKAGTPIVKQGVSDGSSAFSGGWLRLLGEGTNSPHYSVFSRTGLAYNSYTERIRLGNLNGIGSIVSDAFGVFMGNYSTGKYLQYDDVSGNFIVNGYLQSSKGAFGGDGSDGALSIAAGTTTISAGNAQVLNKNYTSISITGTGKLAFTTPHTNGTSIFLKSQGAVTITSTTNPGIDASGMGATGSANNGWGNIKDSNGGNNGTAGDAGVRGTGGSGVGSIRLNSQVIAKVLNLTPGGAGGAGGDGENDNSGQHKGAGGSAGAGGGCLVIECNGAYNFGASSYISVAGVNGSNGGAPSNVSAGAGGAGGGGAGGMCVVLYNALTANSGTYTISGGAGGTGGSVGAGGAGDNSAGGGGGAGGGHVNASGAGGNGGNQGANGVDGSAGSGATGGAAGSKGTSGGGGSGGAGGGGGGGSEGLHFEILNNFFA